MTIIVDPWISGIAVGWLLFCAICCVGGALRLGYAVLVRWVRRWKRKRQVRRARELHDRMADALFLMSKGIKFNMAFLDGWPPEDVEGLKSYGLKGEAAKYLEDVADQKTQRWWEEQIAQAGEWEVWDENETP